MLDNFYFKEFKRGYITFVLDDAAENAAEFLEIFKKYSFPLSCAVIAKVTEQNPSAVSVLKEIEKNSGEILSHTYDHKALSCDSTVDDMEFQLKNSYDTLIKAGFLVNGIIQAGMGGKETTLDYTAIEPITRKYYKYSDAYGVSPQYKISRLCVSGRNIEDLKRIVKKAADNNAWQVLFAHNFSEISRADLKELLDFIKKSENIDLVTYKYMYDKYGSFEI